MRRGTWASWASCRWKQPWWPPSSSAPPPAPSSTVSPHFHQPFWNWSHHLKQLESQVCFRILQQRSCFSSRKRLVVVDRLTAAIFVCNSAEPTSAWRRQKQSTNNKNQIQSNQCIESKFFKSWEIKFLTFMDVSFCWSCTCCAGRRRLPSKSILCHNVYTHTPSQHSWLQKLFVTRQNVPVVQLKIEYISTLFMLFVLKVQIKTDAEIWPICSQSLVCTVVVYSKCQKCTERERKYLFHRLWLETSPLSKDSIAKWTFAGLSFKFSSLISCWLTNKIYSLHKKKRMKCKYLKKNKHECLNWVLVTNKESTIVHSTGPKSELMSSQLVLHQSETEMVSQLVPSQSE